eukprot:TRINITY_DN2029_c0_g1_i1.p1 TRINITY_DN2029_c0_g1~~TRINITY_DN2029_c0_g1_i1.p1  ORF type:complete len:250 (-),score=39.56 TRINITY_DN2029_c0_g1_i1:53-802(-)
MSLDVTKTLKYQELYRKKTNKHLTLTHLCGKACGLAMRKAPNINGRIVFGKFIPHKEISICFLVVMDDGRNLARVNVKNADSKSLAEIISELEAGANSLRKGNDIEFKKTMDTVKLVPTWLLRPITKITGLLASVIGVDIPPLGVSKFPFGSMVISNVGAFGVEEAYAPFTPFFHVPILMLIGTVKNKAEVNEERQIEVRPMLQLMFTLDHRYIDGAQASGLAKELKKLLEDPSLMDDTVTLDDSKKLD